MNPRDEIDRPSPMSAEGLAELLARSGARNVTAATIQADIEAGTPVRPGGLIDLAEYGAWLLANRPEGMD
jgi:hypothetical protein